LDRLGGLDRGQRFKDSTNEISCAFKTRRIIRDVLFFDIRKTPAIRWRGPKGGHRPSAEMVRGQFAMKSSPKVRPILSIDLDDNQPETRTDSFAVGGCKMMRIELMMLLALIAVCARPVSAQAKCPVAEVDQILTNPNQYNGTILALHGIAGTVALQSRTFTVLDAKSSTTGGASARFIRVTFPAKSQIVMPAPGQEVVVVGKIVNRLSTVRSVALQVLTNPSDIRHILAQDSKTRSSGRPSGDLPERNTNH
jgi:hypothetical protein